MLKICNISNVSFFVFNFEHLYPHSLGKLGFVLGL